MASVKELKKEINNTLGDIIGESYEWKLFNPEADDSKTEDVIDEAVAVFDELIVKLHSKNVENKKVHFKSISNDLDTKSKALLAKLNAL